MALLSMPADHPAAQLARTRGIRLVTTDPDDDPPRAGSRSTMWRPVARSAATWPPWGTGT
jgi:hypothetical protein